MHTRSVKAERTALLVPCVCLDARPAAGDEARAEHPSTSETHAGHQPNSIGGYQ